LSEKIAISTDKAPAAIGTYSQAIRHGQTVYISGQIPLDPESMQIATTDVEGQIDQVLRNVTAVCEAAGGSLDDVLKFTVYLTDLANFGLVNQVMESYLTKPYPARAAIEVSALPKAAQVEIDAVMGI
jgi:reactive intermediate/imine deaminase